MAKSYRFTVHSVSNAALSCISMTVLLAIITSLIIFPVSSDSGSSQSSTELGSNRNGPRFLIEPPDRVQFLNETGAVITCKVAGTAPLRVWWSHSDGSTVTDVAGLRMVRPNGDLVLSPFSPSVMRQDIHSTVYRCMATNPVGTIRSRDCQVHAVMHQSYNVQVYGEYAIAANTGHLKCQIPAFVREHVRVTAWLKGDTILATQLTPKDSRFAVLSNGDLLIRNATRTDSGYYQCQTRHELSHQTVSSSIEGHFIVNDVISGVSPRITSQSPVKVELGQSAELVCITKAWPPATVRWFQASESGLITPVSPSNDLEIYDGLLFIRHVTIQHSGNWICVANNSLGEERAYIELHVNRPLKAVMSPEHLVADMSSTATFLCNVTQGTALSILWVKDGQPIMMVGSGAGPAQTTSLSTSGTSSGIGYVTSGEGRIRLIEPHVLNIRSVIQEDAGCYQCIVRGEERSVQATAELKLGDSPPVFVETFADGLVFEQGAQISLRCSATSTLLPQIRWWLDERPIDGYAPRRLTMADYVKSTGHVVSFVNITNAKVIDGGEYRCTASNSAGFVTYSARVNVRGPALLRADWMSGKKSPSITVISGHSVTLICPVIAYPIESLAWQHRSVTLPSNHRHSIEPIIGGVGGKLTIHNVHRDNDQGEYDCTVKGSDGKAVRGSIEMIVRVAPLIDGQLISPFTTVNQGMKVKLMCSVLEGDAPIKIKWYRQQEAGNAVKTNHALGISVQEDEDYSLLTFRSVSISHMGNWTCRAWNDVQTVNRTTNLIVNVAPSWRAEPKNTQVLLGKAISIECGADGYPTPRLVWKKSTTSSTAATNMAEEFDRVDSTVRPMQVPAEYRELLSSYRRQIYPNGTLWIQETDKSDAGFYMCQVSNGIGAGLSKVIQLTVQSPPFFATKFLSKSVSKGEGALLECECEGDPVLHIRWYKDRALISHSVTHSNAGQIEGINGSWHNHSSSLDKRFTIKQDLVSTHKVISFLQIDSVQREDSTIYTCVARNDFGTDNTSVQLIVQEVPDAPQSVEVVEVSSRTFQLQWKSPYSGNSPLIRFYIHYRRLNCTYLPDSEESFWNEVSTQTGNELRIHLKGLLPNCYYQVKLSSENEIGRSEQTSNPITIKTLEEVPGGPPMDVQVETTSSTSLKIKWRPPIRAVQFGRIRGYYIGYKVAGSDEPFQYKNVDAVNDETVNSPSANADSYQVSYITNLKRKTSYVIILQAYNSVGPGPRSDEMTISTFDSQPPTSPLLEVVSTTYDSIVLKWDSSFQQSGDDPEPKEYILYYRQDLKTLSEWHQKRIYSNTNQFVLNKETTQGMIRCGTKYHLYMTATNSLGTGEPSETVVARTKGDTPVAPNKSDFIITNSTTAILALKAWQARGCPIRAFTIQYKPIHQKQWIPLVEYFENRDYFYVTHLSANRDYQLLVSAHSEPGTTRQEYSFHTGNSSAVVRLQAASASASPMDPYRVDSGLNPNSAIHLRNFTVLLPVVISLIVLIVILGTLFGCLRRQHVNHVVNSVDGHSARPHTDLCIEHLTRYNESKENGTMLMTSRRSSQECYPMTEFRTPTAQTNTCPSLNNSSCDSKSNLLNGNLSNGELFGTSPRHQVLLSRQYGVDSNHFATMGCTKMKLVQQNAEQSYYSSPQRKVITAATLAKHQNHVHRSDHEYAEPVQSIHSTRCNVDLLLVSENANNQTTSDNPSSSVTLLKSEAELLALNGSDMTETPQQQIAMPIKVKLQNSNESYATISKPSNACLPYL